MEELSAGDVKSRVYPPKVTVRNNIFPPFEELQNCTTCTRGRKLPSELISDNDYHRRCTWDLKEHIGIKHMDSVCPTNSYVRKKSDVE